VVDKIVNFIFRWEKLRFAIFDEVNLYNSFTRILNDPESMETATALWDEGDGWRGWTIKDDGNYYFHDLPEKSLSDILNMISDREKL
jgi:hypothetical protein